MCAEKMTFLLYKCIAQEANFPSKMAPLKAFCRTAVVEHHIVSPYYHQGNGLAERVKRSLETMLRTSRSDQKD